MKRLSFKIATLMLATVFALSSCVKNEVSDEVKALRAAQLDIVSAKVKLTEAQTTYQLAMAAQADAQSAQIQAQAAVFQANAAQIQAQTASTLAEEQRNAQRFEQELRELVAVADVAVEQAKVDLEQAKVDFQRAVNDMAKAVAQLEADELDRAHEYLGWYQGYMDEVNAKSEEKLDAEADLAVLNAIKAAGITGDIIVGGVIQAYMKYTKEHDRDMKKAELAVAEASLAAYAAILADPASIQAEINDLNVMIQNLIAQKADKQIELDEAELDEELLALEFDRINDIIVYYNNNVQIITDANKAIVAEQKRITDVAADKKAVADSLAKYDAYVVSFKVLVAATPQDQAKIDAKRAQINDCLAEMESLSYSYIQGGLDFRYYYYYETTINETEDHADFTALKNAVESELTEVTTDANANIAALNYDIARATANKVAVQDAYTTAAADKAQIEDDLNASSRLKDAIAYEVSLLDAQIDAYEGEVGFLEGEDVLENIQGLIDGKKEDIAGLKDAITILEADISQDAFVLDNEIAKLTAKIAKLTGEIADNQALANKYKALLDAIIG